MAATPPNPTISFTVMQDPASDRVVVDLPAANKHSVVTEGSVIGWEVTNSLPYAVDVRVIGLEATMAPGFKSSISKLASGARQTISGTVAERVRATVFRGYGIWVKVGPKWTAVDPDLQLDPPPDGGGRAVDLTGIDHPITVTIDSDFHSKHDDESPLNAKVGDAITWWITNTTTETVRFTLFFPNGAVQFQRRQIDVLPQNQTPAKLTGVVAVAGNVRDEETVLHGHINDVVGFDFVFAGRQAAKR